MADDGDLLGSTVAERVTGDQTNDARVVRDGVEVLAHPCTVDDKRAVIVRGRSSNG